MTPRPAPPVVGPWLLAGVAQAASSGGSLRAAHLFGALGERTDATSIYTHGRRGLPALSLAIARGSRVWRSPLSVASAQLIPPPGLLLLRGPARARLLDVHDHPTIQLDAFEIALSARRRRELDSLVARNVAAFELLAVPSASFAQLCDLPADRCIVATNGADAQRIVPLGPSSEPVVAMVSGAAPGRGIELLVAAVDAVRAQRPDVRLRLGLSSTSPTSQRYLVELRRALTTHPWAIIERIPYPALSRFLGEAQVMVIPSPPHPYHDAATPVKLFDSMAAGRPVAVTPRTETAHIVDRWRAGLVAAGDSIDDLAAVILRLFEDESLRHELGANARRAVVEEYDWRVISARVADAVLGSPST